MKRSLSKQSRRPKGLVIRSAVKAGGIMVSDRRLKRGIRPLFAKGIVVRSGVKSGGSLPSDLRLKRGIRSLFPKSR